MSARFSRCSDYRHLRVTSRHRCRGRLINIINAAR